MPAPCMPTENQLKLNKKPLKAILKRRSKAGEGSKENYYYYYSYSYSYYYYYSKR